MMVQTFKKDEKCGNCHKNFNATVDQKYKGCFDVKCSLCSEEYFLKFKCAKTWIFYQNPELKEAYSSKFDQDVFGMAKNKSFFCKSCKEDDCFHCGKPHTGGTKKIIETCSYCGLKWCFIMQQTPRSRSKCTKRDKLPGICSDCKDKVGNISSSPSKISQQVKSTAVYDGIFGNLKFLADITANHTNLNDGKINKGDDDGIGAKDADSSGAKDADGNGAKDADSSGADNDGDGGINNEGDGGANNEGDGGANNEGDGGANNEGDGGANNEGDKPNEDEDGNDPDKEDQDSNNPDKEEQDSNNPDKEEQDSNNPDKEEDDSNNPDKEEDDSNNPNEEEDGSVAKMKDDGSGTNEEDKNIEMEIQDENESNTKGDSKPSKKLDNNDPGDGDDSSGGGDSDDGDESSSSGTESDSSSSSSSSESQKSLVGKTIRASARIQKSSEEKLMKRFSYSVNTKLDRVVIDLPADKIAKFKAVFNKIFGIDNEKEKIIHQNEKDAMNALERMFVTLSANVNIFDFWDLNSTKSILKTEVIPQSRFYLTMNDIDTFTKNNLINEDGMNFILQLLTVYNSIDSSNTQKMPSLMFGTVSESRNLLIDENSTYKKLYKYVNGGRILNADDAMNEMKNWYQQHSKDELTVILDFYETKEYTNLKQYCNIVKVVEDVYCVVKVCFPKKNNKGQGPSVNIMEVMKITKSREPKYKKKLIEIGVWYSKFFSLYWKELCTGRLTDDDFNGNDIREESEKSPSLNERVVSPSKNPSYTGFKITSSNPVATKRSEGILMCLQVCMDYLLEREYLSENGLDYVKENRRRYLSLIHAVFTILFHRQYKLIKSHVNMRPPAKLNDDDIRFFKKIHEMFEDGLIKIDIENNVNANSIFSEYKRKRDELDKLDPDSKLNLMNQSQHKDSDDELYSECSEESVQYELETPRKPGYLNQQLPRLQVAMDQDRDDIYWDASIYKLFLHRELGKNNNPHPQSAVVYPEQMFEKILSFFMERFQTNEKSDGEIEIFEAYIRKLMYQHEVWFVMDTTDDSDQYEIIAALLLESKIQIKADDEKTWKNYAIIHCVGNEYSYNETNHFDRLFEVAIYSGSIRTLGLFVLTKLGQFEYKQICGHEPLKDYLARRHLVEKECFDLVSKNMLLPNSVSYYGHAQDAYTQLGDEQVPGGSMKFFRLWDKNSLMARYENGNFHIYNHVGGWRFCTDNPLHKAIPVDTQKLCKEKPGKIIVIKGFGSRKDSKGRKVSRNDRVGELEMKFRQSYYRSKYGLRSSCVWLGVAAMINSFDEEEANKMIACIDHEENYKKYRWMYLMNIPNQLKRNNADRNDSNILSVRLQESKIFFSLKKITGKTFQKKSDGFKQFILDHETRGRFVVGLESKGGKISHCIAVDCNSKTIYDCMEKYILVLNSKNLNRCVGLDQIGVQSVSHCYEIVALSKPTTGKARRKNLKRKASQLK